MYNNQYQSSSHNTSGQGKRNDSKEIASVPFKPLNVSEYVDDAEKVVNTLKRNYQNKFELTTSKIRNLLAMTSEILNKVNNSRAANEGDSSISVSIRQDLNSLKIRTIYECGREESVKDFVSKAHILEHLKGIGSLDDCELFCHYMEALVAYHRFMGGKD